VFQIDWWVSIRNQMSSAGRYTVPLDILTAWPLLPALWSDGQEPRDELRWRCLPCSR